MCANVEGQGSVPYAAATHSPTPYTAAVGTQGGRRMEIPVVTAASALAQFDVVGLTERFDESLLVLANATGIRHLGYAKLAANNKPKHPGLARDALSGVLADVGARSLTDPVDVAVAAKGRFVRGREGDHDVFFSYLNVSASKATSRGVPREWSSVTRQAMAALNGLSLQYVLERNALSKQKPVKADCNFYPCTPELHGTSIVTETVSQSVSQSVSQPASQPVSQSVSQSASQSFQSSE